MKTFFLEQVNQTMGTLAGLAVQNGVPDALEHTSRFLDEIDSTELSRALMGPKPKVDPEAHLVRHGRDVYLSENGTITFYDPVDSSD